jgi:hypothetical protein
MLGCSAYIIIAGEPANMRRNAWALWLAVQTFKDPAAVIPPEKYLMIHRAVLDACDANDGLLDGLIDDPESRHVDFKHLECRSASGRHLRRSIRSTRSASLKGGLRSLATTAQAVSMKRRISSADCPHDTDVGEDELIILLRS